MLGLISGIATGILCTTPTIIACGCLILCSMSLCCQSCCCLGVLLSCWIIKEIMLYSLYIAILACIGLCCALLVGGISTITLEPKPSIPPSVEEEKVKITKVLISDSRGNLIWIWKPDTTSKLISVPCSHALNIDVTVHNGYNTEKDVIVMIEYADKQDARTVKIKEGDNTTVRFAIVTPMHPGKIKCCVSTKTVLGKKV